MAVETEYSCKHEIEVETEAAFQLNKKDGHRYQPIKAVLELTFMCYEEQSTTRTASHR